MKFLQKRNGQIHGHHINEYAILMGIEHLPKQKRNEEVECSMNEFYAALRKDRKEHYSVGIIYLKIVFK